MAHRRRPRAKQQKSPAYQWYPKEVLSDAKVIAMTNEVEGIYRRLLDHAWLENGLPGDLDLIYPLCKLESRERFEQLWMTLEPHFPPSPDGRRRNPRQEEERKKQRKHSRERKLAAKKRWDKERERRNAIAAANAMQVQCFALAFALTTTDQDPEKQKSSAPPPRRALPAPARMTLDLFEVRPHLLAATHRLIESGAPYIDDDGQPVLSELHAEIKRIASRDLGAEWESPTEISSIVDAALGRRESLDKAAAARDQFRRREEQRFRRARHIG